MAAECEYGVKVTNPFTQLVNEEDSDLDPEELINLAAKRAAAEKETKKKMKKQKQDKKLVEQQQQKEDSQSKKGGFGVGKEAAPIADRPPIKEGDLGDLGGFGTANKENQQTRGSGFGRGGFARGGGRGGGGVGGRGGRGGGFHGSPQGVGASGPPSNLPPRLKQQQQDAGDLGGFGEYQPQPPLSEERVGDRFGGDTERPPFRGGTGGRGTRGSRGAPRGGGPAGGAAREYRRGGGGRQQHYDYYGGEGGGEGGEERQGGFSAVQEGEQHEGGGMKMFGDDDAEKPFVDSQSGGQANRGGSGLRGGGRGAGRGFRGGPRGAYGREGQRFYDRQSGSDKTNYSGVKPMDKRQGGGRGNWGTEADELAGEAETLNVTAGSESAPQAEQQVAPVDDTHPNEGENEEKAEDGAEPESTPIEPSQMTFDEYMSTKKKKQTPLFNVRKAGEGDKAFNNCVPLEKDRLDTTGDSDEFQIVHRPPKRHVVNIDVNFAVDEQRGGYRGGRGRGEGGGYRGGGGGGGGGGRGESFRGVGRGFRGGGGGGRGGGGGGRRGGQGVGEFHIDTESFPALGNP